MSAPQKVANFTRTLIKDVCFQQKYNLSHTQTDLMAYLANLISWATCINGYYLITTKKILLDMPLLHEKTLEASLKVLKDFGLIETTLLEYKPWSDTRKFRGLRLTDKGKEYNSHLVLPPQDERVIELQKKITELTKELQAQKDETKREKELRESIEKEIKTQTQTPSKEQTAPKPKPKKIFDQDFIDFIEETKKDFAKTSEPICNCVPKWDKRTIFSINSYNKLSVLIPTGEYKQVANPQQINDFWHWLNENQDRVGDVIDFSKKLDLKELQKRYIGKDIYLNSDKIQISNIIPTENSKVKIELRNYQHGKKTILRDARSHSDVLFSIDECEKMILNCMSR